jgi:DNA-binding NarL/FixJ family response regulator
VGVLRALVVDDDAVMRDAIALLIAGTGGVSVADTADCGEVAIHLFRQHRPDVIVLDQRMPGLSGLDTAQIILAEESDQTIVLFSSCLDDEVRRRAAEIGVARCVDKSQIAYLPEILLGLQPSA